MKEEGLLDILARKTGYLYLSDLHDPLKYKNIIIAIDEIEEGRFGEKEWQEAFNYINREGLRKGSEKEIRSLFKKRGENNM